MRKLSGLFGALMLVSALVSCGGGDTTVTPPPPQCATGTFCLTISNTFFPMTMTVAAGSTVAWENDSGLHNVTWDTAAGRAAAAAGDGAGDITDFSSGTHTRVFNTAGTFGFHCTIHPGMNGTLTVQ
jgi:plastocyanin